MHGRVLLILVVIAARVDAEGEAQYLQNTIQDLKKQMSRKTVQVKTCEGIGCTPSSPIKRAYNQDNVPSLHFTKAELAALYESAISTGESIKLDTGDGSSHHITAAVHEIDDSNEEHEKNSDDKDTSSPGSGYYYYYYPLKSFVDELTSTPHKSESPKLEESNHHPTYQERPKEKPQVHTHNHQHNVHIQTTKSAMEVEKKKGLEPLFMAISGFIGMTIMFILSVLVLPKFENLKPKGFKDENEIGITTIALEAIEGRDCSERIICELGKTAKAFHLYDNRFVKLLRRMLPNATRKQIEKIGKYTDKKYRCATIQCKSKEPQSMQKKTVKLKQMENI